MFVNWQTRELNIKIVYYGPALGGKTTNLEQIYTHVDPRRRGKMISLKTHEDRTLYFDFLQLELGKIGTFVPKVQLYTVPGQVYYEASRRLVLRGADGIVFVADSAVNRLTDNQEAWENLRMNLAALNIPFQGLPLVVQLNKRDLSDAMPTQLMLKLLGMNGLTSFEAVARESTGVFDTLKAIVSQTLATEQRELLQTGSAMEHA